MKKYKCEKHGFLQSSERCVWSKDQPGRWCMHCMNEMMDKFCGLIEVEVEEEKEPIQ